MEENKTVCHLTQVNREEQSKQVNEPYTIITSTSEEVEQGGEFDPYIHSSFLTSA